MRPVPRQEQGVALLTVLLLVAVLATLAAVVLDDIRFGLRRTANAEAVGQGRWYALGAESLAAARIEDVLRRADGEARLVWREQAVELPLDQGLIRTRIRDASTCFNLNSVAQGRGEVFSPRPEGLAQFKALAVAVGLAPAEAEQLGAALVDWMSLDALLPQADAVIALLPLSPATANLFDAARFAQMKRGALFINVSRGGLVDNAAVLDALESGQLDTAALDVIAGEPEPPVAVTSHPRVIATPHIAFSSPDAIQELRERTVDEVLRAFRGEPARVLVPQPA